MNRERAIFHVWLVPLLWAGMCIGSFFHSGDEHGLFVIGSIAGTWVCLLFKAGSLTTALVVSLPTGMLVMAACGLLLCLCLAHVVRRVVR